MCRWSTVSYRCRMKLLLGDQVKPALPRETNGAGTPGQGRWQLRSFRSGCSSIYRAPGLHVERSGEWSPEGPGCLLIKYIFNSSFNTYAPFLCHLEFKILVEAPDCRRSLVLSRPLMEHPDLWVRGARTDGYAARCGPGRARCGWRGPAGEGPPHRNRAEEAGRLCAGHTMLSARGLGTRLARQVLRRQLRPRFWLRAAAQAAARHTEPPGAWLKPHPEPTGLGLG